MTLHPGCTPVKLPSNGSPADRGSADAYYGRQPDPHKWPAGTYKGTRETLEPGTVEWQAYMDAYNAETDRKDWGGDDEADSKDLL